MKDALNQIIKKKEPDRKQTKTKDSKGKVSE